MTRTEVVGERGRQAVASGERAETTADEPSRLRTTCRRLSQSGTPYVYASDYSVYCKTSKQGIFQDLEYGGGCESAHGGQAIFLLSPWHTARC